MASAGPSTKLIPMPWTTKPPPVGAKPQPGGGHSHSQLVGRSMVTLAADAAATWLMVGAVQLTAALCVDYSLYDRHQWPALLQQVVTMTWEPQAEMLMELYLEHYPDEVVAWRENSGFTMDSAVKKARGVRCPMVNRRRGVCDAPW
ncbi:hypothetical protein ACOMHN_015401 [Nucella lapillus]